MARAARSGALGRIHAGRACPGPSGRWPALRAPCPGRIHAGREGAQSSDPSERYLPRPVRNPRGQSLTQNLRALVEVAARAIHRSETNSTVHKPRDGQRSTRGRHSKKPIARQKRPYCGGSSEEIQKDDRLCSWTPFLESGKTVRYQHPQDRRPSRSCFLAGTASSRSGGRSGRRRGWMPSPFPCRAAQEVSVPDGSTPAWS